MRYLSRSAAHADWEKRQEEMQDRRQEETWRTSHSDEDRSVARSVIASRPQLSVARRPPSPNSSTPPTAPIPTQLELNFNP